MLGTREEVLSQSDISFQFISMTGLSGERVTSSLEASMSARWGFKIDYGIMDFWYFDLIKRSTQIQLLCYKKCYSAFKCPLTRSSFGSVFSAVIWFSSLLLKIKMSNLNVLRTCKIMHSKLRELHSWFQTSILITTSFSICNYFLS